MSIVIGASVMSITAGICKMEAALGFGEAAASSVLDCMTTGASAGALTSLCREWLEGAGAISSNGEFAIDAVSTSVGLFVSLRGMSDGSDASPRVGGFSGALTETGRLAGLGGGLPFGFRDGFGFVFGTTGGGLRFGGNDFGRVVGLGGGDLLMGSGADFRGVFRSVSCCIDGRGLDGTGGARFFTEGGRDLGFNGGGALDGAALRAVPVLGGLPFCFKPGGAPEFVGRRDPSPPPPPSPPPSPWLFAVVTLGGRLLGFRGGAFLGWSLGATADGFTLAGTPGGSARVLVTWLPPTLDDTIAGKPAPVFVGVAAAVDAFFCALSFLSISFRSAGLMTVGSCFFLAAARFLARRRLSAADFAEPPAAPYRDRELPPREAAARAAARDRMIDWTS